MVIVQEDDHTPSYILLLIPIPPSYAQHVGAKVVIECYARDCRVLTRQSYDFPSIH